MAHSELIAALERATGAQFVLDTEIWKACQPADFKWQHGRFPPPAFTASIDAALTLVPEGWSWSVGDLRGYSPPMWRCHVRDHRPESLTPEGHSHIWHEGNTRAGPALALCIAALRARAGGGG